MQYQETLSISANHPCLPGHFPGNPLIPGVVILDHVFTVLTNYHGSATLRSMPWVKFLSPIFPDMEFNVLIEEVKPRRFNFVCTSSQLTLVKGVFVIKGGNDND